MSIPLLLLLALAAADTAGPGADPAPRALELRVDPAEPKQGELVVFELRGARPAERVAGRFLGRRLRFFRDARGRLRALAAVPLTQRPGPTEVEIRLLPKRGEPVLHGRSVTVRAGKFEEQTLRVPPRFVRPPRSERERIRRERLELAALWRAPATPRMWRGDFDWPRRDRICSPFGTRRVFNQRLKSRHWGLDIDGRKGEEVRAIGAGRVVMVAERYFSGGTVVVDHGLRLFSLYFHLSAFDVRLGQRIERGQLLGQVGSTGRSTGPHLHLTIKLEGVSFDPLSLLGVEFDEPEPAPAAPPEAR